MRRIFVIGALLALALGATPAIGQDGTTVEANGKLLLLLDSSGSMKESAGGQTKIAAAKAALKDVVAKLPDDAEVGVRVFGAKVFSAKDEGACTDTQNVVPVGPLDRDRIISAVDGYKPYGETPIGNALKGAAEDLGSEGKRTIVLLSDGEPTCSPDPCKVAKDLRAQGVDLTVNVVGLNVSGKARNALECIAKAGGGTYYDVDKPDELADSLVDVSVRAFREFTIEGKPVMGGESTSDPTPLKPGQYADKTLGPDAPRHYTVAVPRKGGVVVSITARPEHKEAIVESMQVQLTTTTGEVCAQGVSQRANTLQLRSIVSTAAYYSPLKESSKPECLKAKRLVAVVGTDATVAFPYELRVTDVPQVTNVADLPEASADPKGELKAVEPGSARTPVVGGASFSDAPELKPGTYADSIRPGEQLLYKVPVGWGQAPRMTVQLESDAQADQALGVIGQTVMLNTFSPLGELLTSYSGPGVSNAASYRGSEPAIMTNAHSQIKLRNVESGSDPLRALSYAGDFYFSLEFSQDDDNAEYAVPLTISVAVDGTETGVPKFASPPKGPPTEKKSSKDGGGGLPWLPIGIGAGIVVLLGGAFALGRRNRTSA